MDDIKKIKKIFAQCIWDTRDAILAATSLAEINALKKALKMYEDTLGVLDSEFGSEYKQSINTDTKNLYDIIASE